MDLKATAESADAHPTSTGKTITQPVGIDDTIRMVIHFCVLAQQDGRSFVWDEHNSHHTNG